MGKSGGDTFERREDRYTPSERLCGVGHGLAVHLVHVLDVVPVRSVVSVDTVPTTSLLYRYDAAGRNSSADAPEIRSIVVGTDQAVEQSSLLLPLLF
jgi:hypothetical protein